MVTSIGDRSKCSRSKRHGVPPRRPPIDPPVGHAIVWAVLVGVASVTPLSLLGTPSGGGQIPLDLLLHAVGYAILGALVVRARVRLIHGIFVVAGFGLGIEGLQGLLPYRTASLVDAAVNLVGATVGTACYGLVARGRRSPTRTSSSTTDTEE